MRVDALHRRLTNDVKCIHDAITHLWPEDLPAKYTDHSINLQSFLNRLNEYTESFGIHNRIKHDPEMKQGVVVNSAWWYHQDILPIAGATADIHILWHTHPHGHRIHWDKSTWYRRRFFFWQFIMHELIHRYQAEFRKRDHGPRAGAMQFAADARDSTKEREMQEYLGDYDEVETYAFMTALEVFSWWPEYSLQEAFQQSLQYTGRTITPTFNFFTVCFEKNAPAVKTYKRKTRAWLAMMKKHPEVYAMLRLPSLI